MQGETAFKNRPQTGRYRRGAEWNRPVRNLNFAGARKLAYLDYGDAAARNLSEIDKNFVRFERQWDYFSRRLDMVRKPNCRSGCGRCLLPDVLREDRRAVAAFCKSDTTGQSRHACTDNCDTSVHFQMVGMDRRAVRNFFGDAS